MGGDTGPNLVAWWIQFVAFDGKMRALFSLCFGASILLLTMRGEARGFLGTADIHFRRMLWLLLFGMIHAYLIWWGDILYPYALYGLLLYPVRRVAAKRLLIVAGVLLVLMTGMDIGRGFDMKEKKEKYFAAEAARKAGKALTEEQEKAKKEWEDVLKFIQPTPEQVKKDMDAHRGNYAAVFKYRAKEVFGWHSLPVYLVLWDMILMMIVGMAFLKLGILSAERSYRFYVVMGAAGYLVGLPLNAWSSWETLRINFEPITSTYLFSTYQTGRVAVSLGHLSVILLLAKSGAFERLTRSLSAVGRMAFSNYILTSIVCTTLFYGYGLGWYGKLERWQLYLVVPAVWVINLVFSVLWLARFRFGPLEWCWRSLTYWQRQPMRLRLVEAVAVAEVPAPAARAAAAGGGE